MEPRDRPPEPEADGDRPDRSGVRGRPLGPPGRRAARRSGNGEPRTRPLEEPGAPHDEAAHDDTAHEYTAQEYTARGAGLPGSGAATTQDSTTTQHPAGDGARQNSGTTHTGTTHTGTTHTDTTHTDTTHTDTTHTGTEDGRTADGASRDGSSRAEGAQSEAPQAPPGRFTRAFRSVRSGGTTTARASAHAGGAVVRRIRRLTHAQGMGESGLAKLIELNAFHSGGDAAMAIGLAGTLFFAVPSGEARGRVALYLLITMAPFAVVAPLIGPFLDRFRRGRRWAIGSTMALRAFFCWVMAGAVTTGALWLYPLVFGCLIASKAHNVTRAAAVPRLLPDGVALVTANSRISLAGSIGAGVAGAAAGGLAYFGPGWALRFAFVIFTIGTVLAILLPARVDSSEGEEDVRISDIGRSLRGVPSSIVLALRANAAFRVLSGFLLMFMAFLLREVPLPGYSATVQVGAVVGAAGAGNVVGTALGALARARRPDLVVQLLLGVTAVVAALSAIFYGLLTVALLAFAAGFAQQLGKLSLDALIQHEVPEQVRTSVFARSETLLQLSWVIGGGIGIVLPLIPQLGLGLCAAGMVAGLAVVLRTTWRAKAAESPPPSASPGPQES
jgi:MFS family permease